MPLKSLELNLYNMAQTIYKIDATDKAPGRIATEIVNVLQGKNKPSWAPNVDNNTVVEINNADKMRVTGKKIDELQTIMSDLKSSDINLPLQFINMRS